jgi:hypothetical protein
MRGRPALVPREIVLEHIRRLSRSEAGLFRAHHIHGALYARARRQFGSWAAALEAAGIDYRETLSQARKRGAARARPRGPRWAGDPSGNL